MREEKIPKKLIPKKWRKNYQEKDPERDGYSKLERI
jgi:hypothetical protein